MPFTTSEHYHAHVLHVDGKFLGSLERESLQQTVDELIADGHTRLVVDLSATAFMDSTALGLLIRSAERLREAGGDVRLACMQQRVHGLFKITKMLGPVFDNYVSIEAALQSFDEHPAPPAHVAS